MTRLRRARLAGELVALGIYFIPAAVTRRASSGRLFVYSIRDLTRPVRLRNSQPDPRIVWLYLRRLSQSERQVQLDTAHIAVIDNDLFAELALTLRALALE